MKTEITRDFTDHIEDNYFQHFAQNRGEKSDDLRKQFITELNKFLKYKDHIFEFNQFAEEDLAALSNQYKYQAKYS